MLSLLQPAATVRAARLRATSQALPRSTRLTTERVRDYPGELEARILRLHHVEKWRCGTIARQLHLHHTTVRRVLRRLDRPGMGRSCAPP
ncbi:MAG: helix-turn-helix domain-containing protein [Bradyrhizobium sp.]|jgi:hypothetical protein|uniref:helix-turn-helix domain-containing protein n=1 Tax=Bradyrhizobium TaxID=374 RepID=UPI00040256CD|nr:MULTISPECIES: helix-turn-helix domain-containing protein [Bradyrhizobium]MBJ7403809.1 helix-turn-helix domain-containing protein [Bradyrhizobium sp.]